MEPSDVEFRPVVESGRGCSIWTVLMVVVLLAILAAMLIPAISGAREAARRNSCVCHGKQLVLAMHNHHDVFKRFPNVTSTKLNRVRPGSIGENGNAAAGFSWEVTILPYMEETSLYDAISKASDNFQLPAFSAAMRQRDQQSQNAGDHFAHVTNSSWRCPSFSGSVFSEAVEHQSVGGTGVSTYAGLVATDFDRAMSESEEDGPNGVLVPPPQTVSIKDIEDGTSKTFIYSETCERRYTSWYDGTVAWVVGASPRGPRPTLDAKGYFIANGGSTLGDDNYLPATRHGSIAEDWRFGPSSEHSGGVVIHGVADGSVRSVTEDIDPTLYLRLISRAGHELENLPE